VRRVGRGIPGLRDAVCRDLGRAGENISAPLAGLYLLVQGRAQSCEPDRTRDAVRRLLRNILFFADDASLVEQVFGRPANSFRGFRFTN